MLKPMPSAQSFQKFCGEVLKLSRKGRGKVFPRIASRRRQLAHIEPLEQRVVLSSVTGFGPLQYTAFPGEANDVKITPGFLTFVSDSPDVTVIPVAPGFSSNWLAAISVSVGVSIGVEVSVSVPVIPFLLAQDGVYFPSITGAADAFTGTNFAGSIAAAASQAGSSLVAGVPTPQSGNVYHKVTGSSKDVIDDYALYQVVADPNVTLAESGSITDINSAVFKSGSPGKIVTGSAAQNQQDSFVFNAQAGKRYVVMLDSDPEKDGKLTSTSLKISDLTGFITNTPLKENLSISGYNAVGAIDVSTSGPYFVQVENTGFGTDSSYRYVVLEVDPVADQVLEGSPTVTSLDVPKAIPDYSGSPGTATSTLTVSGFAGVLTDLDATLNISHTYDSDLTVKLKSPLGTEVTLFSGVGGSSDNFTNTTFDDDFSFNPIGSGSAPFSSTFAPSSPLSAFNGEDPNGVWTLTVIDNAVNDTGTLNSWSLKLSPPPSNDTPSGAKTLPAGKFGKGQINPIGETDYWVSSGATAGSAVFSYIDTNSSTKNKDSKLTVLANDGTTVIASDDNSGPPGISRATLGNLMNAFSQGGVDLNALSNTKLSGVIVDLGDRNDRADLSALNTATTVRAGTGDDFVIGGGGDDAIELGEGADTGYGGAGRDTISGGLGDDIIFGGPGDDNLDGGDGSDTFLVSTDFSSTDNVTGGAGHDLFLTVGTDADDVIIVTIDQSAPLNQVIIDVNGAISAYNISAADIEQLHIRGGLGNDKLTIVDAGLGATGVVQYFKGKDGTSGLIRVGSNAPYITFNEMEEVVPLDGPLTRADHTARLVVFKPDPFEVNGSSDNDSRILATYLGSGAVINVDPTIAVPGDVDFYQFTAGETGTLDFQIYFEQNVGLPGNGNLDIQLLDLNGNVIGSSLSNNDNERIRVPVVQGQTYFLKVFGATGTEINTYDMSIVNSAAPVPTNLELHDTQTTPPSVSNSDTGRSQFDNVTADNTPTILLRLADAGLLNDLPGNGTSGSPPDRVISIPFNPATTVATAVAGFRVAIFDENNSHSPVATGFAQPVAGQPGVYSFTFSTPLADGSHFLSARVQMIDPANPTQMGLGAFSAPLEIVVDTLAPPTVQTPSNRQNLDLDAASDSGVPTASATFTDRITNDTTPTFFGSAEANSIVRLYATNSSGTPVLIGQTVASPTDGTNQAGQAPSIGRWQLTSNIDLNSTLAGFAKDGLRVISATFEDLAGNLSAPVSLNIFLDTQGPQVTNVQITSRPTYDLFDPKPSAGPTPRTDSLTISFQDLPNRATGTFPGNQALLAALAAYAAEPGHYVLRGDANGIIPIETITINFGSDTNGAPATATAVLTFASPLLDDRYTLTVSDSIFDPAGNRLDGESNASEPRETQNFPSGDGVPGGDFKARFTIDSRSEIGIVGQGGFTVDINGNMYFDPANADHVNRDLVFEFGVSTDRLFAGKFTAANAVTQDGFDRLGAYGMVNSKYRWLLDFNNDGRPDYSVISGVQVNATPFAGNFNTTHPGDEIGLFDGTKWYLDTNGNNNIDTGDRSFTGNMTGLPITGDFDGDGKTDLATHSASLNKFFFDLSSAADGTPGVLDGNTDYVIDFSNSSVPNSQTPLFPGVLERPFAGDFNLDGITDIGLMVPNRDGANPSANAEFFIFQSVSSAAVPGTAAALNHQFSPKPLGNDLYAQFGTNVSIPLVGNFDPPVAGIDGSSPGGATETSPTVTLETLDSSLTESGSVSSPDAGTVRIRRTGSFAAPLTVNFIKGGSAGFGADYTLSLGGVPVTENSVVIPAGEEYVDLVVTSIDDVVGEFSESIILSLLSSQNYQLSAQGAEREANLTLGDNELLVTISALDGSATETASGQSADGGIFRIRRTGETSGPLTVDLTREGSAKFKKDYVLTLNGSRFTGNSVVIPAGQSYVDLLVAPNDDKTAESTETVAISLVAREPYLLDLDAVNRSAAVSIADNDAPKLKKTRSSSQTSSTGPATMSATSLRAAIEKQVSVQDLPAFPNYSGTWNLSASALLDGKSLGSFTGTVQLIQENGTLTGIVSLQGLPSFKVKGKLDPEELNQLAGKARFPIEIRPGFFLKLKQKLDLVFAPGGQTFTGSIHRSLFGFDLDVTLSATKQS